MLSKKSLSEAAQWFLKDLQRILDSFSNDTGIQVVIINKEGELINETYEVQKTCKLIAGNEDGRIRCKDHFRTALSLAGPQKKTIYTECYAGFASVWIPIIIKGNLIGVIIGCGGRYDKGESRKKMEEKFSKLASDAGIMQRDHFIKVTIEEIQIITKEDLEKRAKRLKELFDILTKTAYTPLKEVFG